jgi:hypothetical protein
MGKILAFKGSNWLSSMAVLFLLYFLVGMLTACSKKGGFEQQVLDSSSVAANDSAATVPVGELPPAAPIESSTFSPNFKPMALSWESATRPERTAWSSGLYNLVSKYHQTLSRASDIQFFCPQFALLSRDQQINAFAAVIAATTYFESGYNPLSNSVDVGVVTDKDTYSVGLLQLSVVDQKNYGFQFGFNFADLQDPLKNLALGLAIMNKQISKYGKILISVGETGLYWAVLHPAGRYDQSTAIANIVKARISFCL